MSVLTSDKPVMTALAAAIALVVVVAGAVVTITNPQSLSFDAYIRDVAILGGALGLGAGVGRGIDSSGQALARTTLEDVVKPPVERGGPPVVP